MKNARAQLRVCGAAADEWSEACAEGPVSSSVQSEYSARSSRRSEACVHSLVSNLRLG